MKKPCLFGKTFWEQEIYISHAFLRDIPHIPSGKKLPQLPRFVSNHKDTGDQKLIDDRLNMFNYFSFGLQMLFICCAFNSQYLA